jgi:hypothetical protein
MPMTDTPALAGDSERRLLEALAQRYAVPSSVPGPRPPTSTPRSGPRSASPVPTPRRSGAGCVPAAARPWSASPTAPGWSGGVCEALRRPGQPCGRPPRPRARQRRRCPRRRPRAPRRLRHPRRPRRCPSTPGGICPPRRSTPGCRVGAGDVEHGGHLTRGRRRERPAPGVFLHGRRARAREGGPPVTVIFRTRTRGRVREREGRHGD